MINLRQGILNTTLKFKSCRNWNSTVKMSKFTMTVNPVIGKKEWVEKPEYYDYYQEVAR